MTRSSREVLGTGVAFPLNLDVRGQLGMVSGERAVSQAILMLLMTSPGQRVMRPDYGCRIHELMFAPGDPTTLGLAAYYVEEALKRWEPRIELQEVKANVDPDQPGRLLISISYRLRNSPESRSLVFPFYRQP